MRNLTQLEVDNQAIKITDETFNEFLDDEELMWGSSTDHDWYYIQYENKSYYSPNLYAGWYEISNELLESTVESV